MIDPGVAVEIPEVQEPVIPLFEIVGNTPGVAPTQYGPSCEKIGVTNVVTFTHC